MDKFAKPAQSNAALIHPARPKTARSPKTPTITGRIKGAPNRVIRAWRPGKLCRAKARATGIAIAMLNDPERLACHRVNLMADQSALFNAPSPRPWKPTTKAVPREKMSRAIKTAPPRTLRSIIARVRSAIHPKPRCAALRPAQVKESKTARHSMPEESHRAIHSWA